LLYFTGVHLIILLSSIAGRLHRTNEHEYVKLFYFTSQPGLWTGLQMEPAMIEEVSENIYRIVLPLPPTVVGSMNSYIFIDPARNLIVDPGQAHSLSFEAMRVALNRLGVDLRQTDFFVTHHHPDHFSLVSEFMTNGSVIYINRLEADLVEKIASGSALIDLAHLFDIMGFPEKDPVKLMPEMAGEAYRARQCWPFRYLGEGDVIENGGWRFRCIVTPGHSLAHTCLYELDRKILCAGDAVSPVLQFYSDRANPLADCLMSLDRLYQMHIDLVLPGHHSPFKDCRKRIDRLKAHFKEKLETVFTALTEGGQDCYQAAAKIWRSTTDDESWDKLPPLQKFLFARDCFAHLRYLEVEGRVREERQDQRIRYFQETPESYSRE
jgi:glyoxylase-like metal-dependent hydrolase (beta-lactamase superfamily II)